MTNLYVAMNLNNHADGTILLGEKMICPTIPHPTVQASISSGLIGPNVSITVQKARDGTLIRMFHMVGIDGTPGWHCATNYSLDLKKVNARLGQTKTFQTMLEEAMSEVGLTFSDLDTGLIYFFMLEHPDNIIVLQHQRPNLSPVMTVRLLDVAPYYEAVDFSGGLLEKTKMVDSRLDISVLTPYLAQVTQQGQQQSKTPDVNLTGPVTQVGIIVNVINGKEFTRFRINTPEYDAAKELLSTSTNKPFRCLQILCGKNAVNETRKSVV